MLSFCIEVEKPNIIKTPLIHNLGFASYLHAHKREKKKVLNLENTRDANNKNHNRYIYRQKKIEICLAKRDKSIRYMHTIKEGVLII